MKKLFSFHRGVTGVKCRYTVERKAQRQERDMHATAELRIREKDGGSHGRIMLFILYYIYLLYYFYNIFYFTITFQSCYEDQ